MLSLANRLQAAKGSLAAPGVPDADEAFYELGGPGQSDNSVVYQLAPVAGDETSTTVSESKDESFLYLDPTDTTNFSSSATFSSIKQGIENGTIGAGSVAGETYNDWEVVVSNDLTYSNPVNAGYYSYDTTNPNPYNYLNAHLFERNAELFSSYSGGSWSTELVSNLSSNWDLNFMVVFQLGSNTSNFCVLKKALPLSLYDSVGDRAVAIGKPDGWDFIPSVGETNLGSLIHSLDSEGNLKNVVYLASSRSHVADFTYLKVAVPQTYINTYDSNSTTNDAAPPNGLSFNVLSAYGDLLDPNRLLESSVERYNKNEDYKVLQEFTGGVIPSGADTGLAAGNGVSTDETKNFVSITSGNRQITIRVIFCSPVKPPSPWYDRAPNESISARITVQNLRDSNSSTSLVNLLSSSPFQSILETTATSFVNEFVVAGETIYYASHTFNFDVSDVPVYTTASEKAALGITENATTEQLSIQPAPNTLAGVRYHQAMIFRVPNIQFRTVNTNNTTASIRSYSDPISGLKTLGNVLVPTLNISNYDTVGDDASIFMMNLNGAVVNRSVKSGVTAPDVNANEFKFEFDVSQSAQAQFTSNENSAVLEFDTIYGAFNRDGEFVYIDATNQQTKFSGYVKLIIDESAYPSDTNLALDLKLALLDQEISLGNATYSNAAGIGTYEWTFDNVFLTLTGAANYSVKEVVTLRAKVLNGSRPNGDYDFLLDVGSNFSGVEDNTAQSPAPPQSDPTDLISQEKKIVPKYNKYV